MTFAASAWTLLALLSATIEPIIVKLGYGRGVMPFQLLTLKMLIGGVLILPLTRTWHWIDFEGVKKITFVSILLLITNGLVLVALQYTTAVTVITLVSTTPALVALVNKNKGRDVIGAVFWAGFLLCFAGVLLTIEVHKISLVSTNILGIICLLGSVISSTIYRTKLDGVTEEYPPVLVSTYIFLINAFLVSCFVAPWVWPVPKEAWTIGAWIGFAGAIANVAFLAALHLVGSTNISIFNMLQRPFIIIAAAIILKEPITLLQVAGIFMVLIGTQIAKVKKLELSSQRIGQQGSAH